MYLNYVIICIISVSIAIILMRASNRKKIPVIMTLVAVSASVLIYFYIGNSDYADQPYKTLKAKESELNRLSVDELITLYEQGLKHKDTAEARLVLGNLLRRLGRLEQARTHFYAAYTMDTTDNPNIAINYADIMIALNKGIVTPKTLDILTKILNTDAKNPQALLYKGLYAAQNKDPQQAKTIWQTLLTDNQHESFYPMLVDTINAFAKQHDIAINIPQNTSQQITADNLPMIENMVESLAHKVKQDPNNQELKQRLIDVQKKLAQIKKNILK